MTFDEFVQILRLHIPDEIDWHIEMSSFRGNDLRYANVQFDFNLNPEEDDE